MDKHFHLRPPVLDELLHQLITEEELAAVGPRRSGIRFPINEANLKFWNERLDALRRELTIMEKMQPIIELALMLNNGNLEASQYWDSDA